MSDKVKGITVKFGGDTTELSKALKQVESESKSIQSQLKAVNAALKLDPKNTELVKQKQELLASAIQKSKDKLSILNQEQQKLQDISAKGGKVSSQAMGTVSASIQSTKNEITKLQKEIDSSNSKWNKFSESAKKVSEDAGKTGTALTKGVTAPIVAAGVAGVASFKSVDDGMDIIVEKTGASGDALEGLEDVAKNIATEIPTGFEEAGTAVGEVNTRFGLTGDALKSVSKQFIEFAKVNNTDLNGSIGNTQKILSQYNMDVSDAGNLLGLFTSVSQKTGVSVDDLMNSIQTNGATFQEMGLSASDAAVMIGKFEQNGLNADQMLTGLKKAASNYSKEGKSMSEGLNDLISKLQDSSTSSSATAEAYDIFGSKAGLAFVNAAKAGKINLSDLGTTLSDYGSTVDDTYKGTIDGIDALTTAGNAVKEAFAAIGSAIGETVAPMLSSVAGFAKDTANWFEKLSPDMKKTIVQIALVAAAVGPVLLAVKKVTGWVGNLKAGISLLSSPISITVLAIAAATAAVIYLWNNCEWFRNMVTKAFHVIQQTAAVVWPYIQSIITSVWNVVSGIWNTCAPFFKKMFQVIWNVVSTVWPYIQNAIVAVWNTVSSIWSACAPFFDGMFKAINLTVGIVFAIIGSVITTCWNTVKAVWDFASPFFEALFNGISAVASPIWDAISSFATGAWDVISSVWNGVSDFFSGIWNAVASPVEGIWSGIEDTFSGAIDWIKGLFNFDWHWPSIPLPHFSMDPPDWQITDMFSGSWPSIGIDWYAKGAILTAPTIFGLGGSSLKAGGEAGPEGVLPLNEFYNNLHDYVAEAIDATRIVVQSGSTAEGQGGFVQNNAYYSPKSLDPSESARLTRQATQLIIQKIRK
ncbi:MAG: phage tail tape measure protein [Solobacterium sp.]|jgi:TP901 family phage tail tape measure protein|nr:phage tail tape measure protein [Solobacterium sp.]MCH4205287.1 phage tail tape measure protein [Solobacterium sp.]MCH4226880.1 phage tail tape measure protein [Solobacterium sp.]MCH4281640.1 phage tail tape measure protein [Solobacterium sp.]